VDLLECLSCERRFIVAHAGVGEGWGCPDCGDVLALVAIGLPGTAQQVSTALNARHLLSLSLPPDRAVAARSTSRRDRETGVGREP
jgi:hypothetical protein